MYSNTSIDIGVALLAGAVVTTWAAINLPQTPLLINPVPPSVANQVIYVLNSNTPQEQKYTVSGLTITRTGPVLETAFSNLEDAVGPATISVVPLTIGVNPPVNHWIVCIDNVIVYDTQYDRARWKAAGIWQILHP